MGVNDTFLKTLQEVEFRLLASNLFHFIITAGKNEFTKTFVLRKGFNFFEDFLQFLFFGLMSKVFHL